jgi:hypothetical protein
LNAGMEIGEVDARKPGGAGGYSLEPAIEESDVKW